MSARELFACDALPAPGAPRRAARAAHRRAARPAAAAPRGVAGPRGADLLAAVAGERAEQSRSTLEHFDAGRRARARSRERRVDGALPSRRRVSGSAARPRRPARGAVRAGRLRRSTPARASRPSRSSAPRSPSPYGTEVAHSLGRGLGAAGVPVVSGLALGIDATAHRGCLDGGGLAVAVLAGGPDVVYPRRHRRLHERIARERARACPSFRPARARSAGAFRPATGSWPALSRMTVVVEAADPSGSLITTDFARDLGRSVAAVPGRVTSHGGRAAPTACSRTAPCRSRATEDVLDELFGVGARGRRGPARERAASPTTPAAAVLDAAERRTRSPRSPRPPACRRPRRGRRSPAWRRGGYLRAPQPGRLGARARARPYRCRGPVSRSAAHPTAGALHRRLGLRRRRGHPGRPQGVRPLRRRTA